MKAVLSNLTTFFIGIIKWMPIAAKASFGAIGDFLDALNYATVIIIGIFALIPMGIRIIRRWLNR